MNYEDEEYVRYVLIPTITITANDDEMTVLLEWWKWGIGFQITRRM